MTHVELDDPSDRRDGRIADRASEARQHILNAVTRQSVLNGLNFGVGLVIATIGLFMLYKFLPKTIEEFNTKGAPLYFLARVSLVTLTETFAFFFLKLHRFGLGEGKYFRDELSNINMRVLGLRVALEENDSTSVTHILKALGDTDRHPDRMAPSRKRGDESLKVAEDLIKLAGKLVGGNLSTVRAAEQDGG